VRILWRYVLTRYLRSLFSILLVLILLILVIEILLDVDRIIESGISMVVLKILSSYVLQYLLPASALAAAFVSLGSAARAREITAMKAGGVSPLVAIVPILLTAGLLSAVSFVLGDTVVVAASQAFNRDARGNAGDLAVRRGTFWYHKGRYIYNFGDRDPDTSTVYEVTVFELDDRNRLRRRIEAGSARVEDGNRWSFRGAAVHHFDPDRPGEPPGFERADEITLELDEQPSAALLKREVGALSIGDLRTHAALRESRGRDASRAWALLNERFTEPFSVLLFALLAVPLGIRVEQTRSLAMGALHAVLIMFAYYSLRELTSTLALEGVIPASAPWGVVLLFLTVAGVRLARMPR
jgi:LPS export ABC transporter permease LptG